MVDVDHCVPESMQLIHVIVVLQQEVITTSISSRKSFINSVEAVEWLVDISQKVDEESNSNGPCIGVIVMLGNGGVGDGVLVTGLTFKPAYKVSDHLSDVLGVLTSPFRVVRYRASFI